MTANQRIFINVIATYGRSVYALALGLFTARWILMALGEVDFGLYGVVGGLTFFVIFINELLAMSVARFFGVNVGAARKKGGGEAEIEECRKWFNTAILVHTIVPICLVIIGYPVGVWAVRNFLTIPVERINSCVWVWNFTCLSCFIGMVNVPFRAMYTARQEIAELTIYSFCTTTLTACVLYYMASRPGDWLLPYACWTCVISIVPNILIAWRALVKYPECQFDARYFWSRSRIKDICSFAAARFCTSFSSILVSQGHQILVNKYLGPQYNAAMRIGSTVASHSATLAGSLNGAFWPAITNAVGEGSIEKVRHMSFRVCRMSTFLVLVFAAPLILECREVLRLWLGTPPGYSAEICVAILVAMLIDRTTEGYWMAVMGLGNRISFYSCWVSVAGFVGFLATWTLFASGFGIWSVCLSAILCKLISTGFRLWLGWLLAGLSPFYWIRYIAIPLFSLLVLGLLAGWPVVYFMDASFLRVVSTTCVCELILIPSAWYCVLTEEEREAIRSKVIDKVPFFR